MKLLFRVLFLSCLAFAISGVSVRAQTASSYDTLVRNGNSQLQAGNNTQAVTSANSAIKLNATRWEAYVLAGGALMNLKKYEEAADQFGHAIDHAPEAKQAGLRELRRQCLLAETGASPSTSSTPAIAPAQPAATTQAEIVLWKTIQDSKNVDDFQAYLQQYPNGAFVVLARNHIESLKKQYFDQGRDFYNSGNYSAAFAELQKSCDTGNFDGCDFIGALYEYGQGVVQNPSRAVQFFEKACDMGSTDGCARFASMFELGEGVGKNPALALQFYQKSCDGGDANGCTNLGRMYATGQGVTKDYARAVQLFQKTCDGGYAIGCTDLGGAYAYGWWGFTQDNAKAKQLYQKACTLGDKSACGR
jgi:uncharacterized protein